MAFSLKKRSQKALTDNSLGIAHFSIGTSAGREGSLYSNRESKKGGTSRRVWSSSFFKDFIQHKGEDLFG